MPIHSCAQFELHKHLMYAKSMKVGVNSILKLYGYIILLNIWSGLLYLTIWPYTNKELGNLPYTKLTADIDWDPTVIDCELEDGEECFDAWIISPNVIQNP